MVQTDYARTPPKPTVMDEGAYEAGSEYGYPVTPLLVRRQAWGTVCITRGCEGLLWHCLPSIWPERELHSSHNEVLPRVIAGYQGAYSEMFRHASSCTPHYQEAAAHDYSQS